ncbi:hypothetical protein DIPPA_58218, partial [Diplonema papillatum]
MIAKHFVLCVFLLLLLLVHTTSAMPTGGAAREGTQHQKAARVRRRQQETADPDQARRKKRRLPSEESSSTASDTESESQEAEPEERRCLCGELLVVLALEKLKTQRGRDWRLWECDACGGVDGARFSCPKIKGHCGMDICETCHKTNNSFAGFVNEVRTNLLAKVRNQKRALVARMRDLQRHLTELEAAAGKSEDQTQSTDQASHRPEVPELAEGAQLSENAASNDNTRESTAAAAGSASVATVVSKPLPAIVEYVTEYSSKIASGVGRGYLCGPVCTKTNGNKVVKCNICQKEIGKTSIQRHW